MAQELNNNLDQIAQLIKDFSGAQSVLIFSPIKNPKGEQTDNSTVLSLSGLASEQKVDRRYLSKSGAGFVGWIAKSHKPANVSPFSNTSRSLGFYHYDCPVQSIFGLPIISETTDLYSSEVTPVLYCDSEKAGFFTPELEAYLQKACRLISSIMDLERNSNANKIENLDFAEFYSRAEKLLNKLGASSVEILRLRLVNSSDLEKEVGFPQALSIFQRMQRLIQQVLPPNYPVIHSPSGETIIVLDNMMSAFYENKIRIIASQISPENVLINYDFQHFTVKNSKISSIDDLFNAMCSKPSEHHQTTQKAVPLNVNSKLSFR